MKIQDIDRLHHCSPYYQGKEAPIRDIKKCPLCLNYFEDGVELDEVPEGDFIPDEVCKFCGEGEQ